MLALCHYHSPYMYVYNTNGSYTGLNMSVCATAGELLYMNFDSKDRLIITSQTLAEIYY